MIKDKDYNPNEKKVKIEVMKELTYISKDKSVEIKILFIIKNQLKYQYVGKTYPKHTQCLVFVNGLLKCFGTVVKHYKDEDNQIYAYKGAMKKAIEQIDSVFIKSEVPRIVNDAINKNEL